MKKLLYLLLITNALHALPGERLFDQHCAKCHHKEKMSLSDLKLNKHRLKAPPMNLVIERLKEVIVITVDDEDAKQAVITAFIKDYIQAPSIDKGLCRIGCFIQFGEMPKLSSKPSNDELNVLTAWLYEKF